MPYLARLLAVTAVLTIGLAGTALPQTQPREQTVGVPSPGAGAERWKLECETRADEKGLKGTKRTAAIKKCVSTGELPRELR
jgi:hypothetical protein